MCIKAIDSKLKKRILLFKLILPILSFTLTGFLAHTDVDHLEGKCTNTGRPRQGVSASITVFLANLHGSFSSRIRQAL